MLSHIRVSEVENNIKDLYKLWIKKKNGSGLILVELKQWFRDMNLNVILRMIAGKRYFGTSDGVNEEEAHRCQKALGDFFRLLGLFVVSDAIPFLGWLDLGGHEEAMKKTVKELDGILGEWLEEHKRKRASSKNKEEEDFMDIMLSVLDGAELEGYDADTINKATCLVRSLSSLLHGVLLKGPCLNMFQARYDISIPSDAKVDMTETVGLTNNKATPLEVLIKPRLHLPSFMD
ncbi:hypothetical protein SO802_004349 [Lithocarpus litseifolius]|uniref:Uncharacterized protein n=1 Tax=Lithocarpus litseifolius TaxID=425828 RepID=A0AAW2E2P7_9ROSI